MHRYSFNDWDSSDSYGGAEWNGAAHDVTFNGSSAAFGPNGYISLPGGCFESSTTVSLEMWVTTDPIVDNSFCQRLLAFGSGSDDLLLGACGESSAYVYIEGSNEGASSTPLYGQTGQHIVLVVSNAAEMKLYVNGYLSATSVGIYPLKSDDTFIIGASLGMHQSLTGSFDEFRIWRGALSSSRIYENFLAGPNGNLPNPVAQPTPTAKPTLIPQGIVIAIIS